MPELNGLELSKLIRAARPETTFLFITGFGDQFPELREYGENVLEKPFLPSEPLREVEDILNLKRCGHGHRITPHSRASPEAMPLLHSPACPLSRTRPEANRPIRDRQSFRAARKVRRRVAESAAQSGSGRSARPISVRVLIALSRSRLVGDLPFFPVASGVTQNRPTRVRLEDVDSNARK